MATATRDGIALHYEVSGSGPAIVLTHSFLCDGSLFTHQVAALERTHRDLPRDRRHRRARRPLGPLERDQGTDARCRWRGGQAASALEVASHRERHPWRGTRRDTPSGASLGDRESRAGDGCRDPLSLQSMRVSACRHAPFGIVFGLMVVF